MYLKCMFGFRPTADGSQTYTAPQFSGFVQICLRNSCLLHLASRDRKSRAYTYVIQSPALLGKHQNFKRMKYLSFLCHSKCAAVEAHKYIQYSPSVSMKGSMFLKLRPKKNQAPTTVKLSYRHRSTYAVQDSMWSVLVLPTHHIWAFVGTRPWTFTCSSTVQNCSKNRGRCNLLELPNLLKQRGSQYLCFPFRKLDAKGIEDWGLESWFDSNSVMNTDWKSEKPFLMEMQS